MMKKLCEFLLSFDCSESGQNKVDKQEKINALEKEITLHLNTVQELKAIHDYQTSDLEKKIAALEVENISLKKNLKSKEEKC